MTKVVPTKNDWTRPKYAGFKPLHELENMKGIKIVLADYLEKIGLSQRALSELCDLSQPAINDFCANRTQLFNIANIVRIVSVLGCSLNDVFEVVPEAEAEYTAYETEQRR